MDSRQQMDSPTHEEIAARAYEIYNREGGQHGRDSDHWFQAEQELRAQRSGGRSGANQTHGTQGSGNIGTAPRNTSGGLGQPVTGEAAMNAAKSLGNEDASMKKSKGNGSSKAGKR